jgi:3-oxoacyl-[acyl-carrier-protein] synthase III
VLVIPGTRISGLGEYRPETVVSNADIYAKADLEAGWITARTGIRERRHANADETISAMARAAGESAVSHAGLSPDAIDLVIVATSTSLRTIPGLAAGVAARLEIPNAGAFDVNAVCAGFTYALSTASDAVRLGRARHALVIGAERLSDWIGPAIPDTYAIFGDGAAAAVVSPATAEWIGPPAWGSDGNRSSAIEIPAESTLIHMSGMLVYKWAVTTIPGIGRIACERAGLRMANIDWLVPHQANARIIAGIARELEVPPEKVISIIEDSGNTSAASIPAALSRLTSSGRARTGDWALLLGYGAGLTYSAQVVRLP